MRVVVAHNFYQQPGGEDGVFHDECALLESKGHDVVKLERHNSALRDGGASRVGLAIGTVWNRDAYREVRRIIRDTRADVLHAHNTLPLLSPSAYHAARAEGAAVVQTLHNYRMMCAGALFYREGKVCEDCLGHRFALAGVRHGCYRGDRAATASVAASTSWHWLAGTWTRTVNRYIAMTEFGKSRFVAGGIPAERIVVKPHFVRDAPEAGTGDGDYILFVGRLTEEKGIGVLAQAWERQSQRQRSNLRLSIVGDGPERASLERLCSRDERVTLHGQKEPAEVLNMMRRAVAVVVPSTWYETFGRVVTESLACGTPVIVSDIGAIAELVEDGVTGFRFQPGDADALANRLQWLADNREALSIMRTAARAAFLSRYTPEANYPQLLSVYESAIDDARSDDG